jgi:hypothetical protein
MTPSRKTLVLPLAGLLLVGAAGAAVAASSPSPSPGGGSVAPAADPSPSAGTTTTPDDPADPGTLPARGFLHEDGLLDDLLDALVADGTITADQRQAIVDALAAERDARIAEAQERAEQLRSFLEDGAITQEEFDQLPEDSRLRELAGIMDDGQITTEELRSLGGFGGRGHGFGPGRGFGPGVGPGFGPGFGPDWDKDPMPTPSATPGS